MTFGKTPKTMEGLYVVISLINVIKSVVRRITIMINIYDQIET
jgi:hypothetical protein